MKKELIIVGAGGFAKEVLAWLPGTLQFPNLIFKGFLDDELTSSDFGCIKKFQPNDNQVFICTIGDSKNREKIYLTLMKQSLFLR